MEKDSVGGRGLIVDKLASVVDGTKLAIVP